MKKKGKKVEIENWKLNVRKRKLNKKSDMIEQRFLNKR